MGRAERTVKQGGQMRHWAFVIRRGAVTLLVFITLIAARASASDDASTLCEWAATTAAETSGVPTDILRALTLTETGRSVQGVLRPWPWAINQGGDGQWFASRDQMLAHAQNLIASGVTNFDIGCFQLNYRWHAQGFASLDDMADPAQNARYAAAYLLAKYQTTGDWGAAAAAYHSATPEHATRYLARFSDVFASLGHSDVVAGAPTPAIAEPDRPNTFPLLVAGRGSSGGSLVPLVAGMRPLFGGSE
jgi:Transglycosylase SLT domain